MRRLELLPKGEKTLEVHAEPNSADVKKLEENSIRSFYAARRKTAEYLRPLISLKFYHAIKEKLDWEETVLKNLLASRDKNRKILARYSLVLDQRYFEQKFLAK